MKFAFIAAEKAFPVAAMCRVFSVTRQGYYAYHKRQAVKQPAEVELQAQVKSVSEFSCKRTEAVALGGLS